MFFPYLMFSASIQGHVVEQLVEALRYKPEGRGFDESLEFFIDIILWPPITEMSTRNISWG
jgi:hypothetical protein